MAHSVESISVEKEPLNSVQGRSVEQEPLNVHFEPLVVPCRYSHSSCQSVNSIMQWLVCWPDPYQTSYFPIILLLWAIVAIILDMGSDLWVAKTHYVESHFIWTYLTLAFFFLPIVFALGYTVLLRRSQRWYQVHPIGQFYWSFRILQAYKRRTKYRVIESPDEATSFIHYTHEMSRGDTRYRFISADESYLESFPECVLQAYFIARLWSYANYQDESNEITWNMWLSVGLSAISLVGCESNVPYNRHFINTVLEPSICDISFRFILDLLCVTPRLAAIACFFTLDPKEITVSSFIILHMLIVYLWFRFSERKTDSAFEEYRGYKEHQSKLINQLRATVVSFLFPPTCSWHLHEVARELQVKKTPSSLQQSRSGLQRQFWIVSAFQFVESGILFGLWLYFKHEHTGELYRILIPTLSLTLLLIRPFCDVLCQRWILIPIAESEAVNCTRFKGLVAKTRILEVGSDIVNIFTELLHRLHDLESLFREPITDESRAAARKECQLIAGDFVQDEIIQRHNRKRTRTMTSAFDKVTASPGPKTKDLLNEVGQKDMELLQNVVLAAEQWQSSSATADVCAVELRDLINRCEGRVNLWEEIFILCLNHKLLPENFYDHPQTDNEISRLGDKIYADYKELIHLNREANPSVTFSRSQESGGV